MQESKFFQTGDFIVPVPLGIPLTIQYDVDGIVEKAFIGYGDSKVNATDKLQKVMHTGTVINQRIPLKGGYFWVEGVLDIGTTIFDEGDLPNSLMQKYIDYAESNPTGTKFYAVGASSTGAFFKGAIHVREWLKVNHFNVLNGLVAPAKVSVFDLVTKDAVQFNYPKIMYVGIYHLNNLTFVPTGIKQITVGKPDVYLRMDGTVCGKISNNLEFSYAKLAEFDIGENTNVVLDDENHIICAEPIIGKKHSHCLSQVTCEVCGRRYVSEKTVTRCPDEHCPSNLYGDVIQMLTVFNLPYMEFDEYLEIVKQNPLFSLIDVFDLPTYQDSHIEVTLTKLFEAITPRSFIPDTNFLAQFCGACNNTKKTVLYYVLYPEKIATELSLSNKIMQNRLVEWLSDGYNTTLVTTMMDLPQISIVSTGKKFDGVPMFIGKTICITGTFARGTLDDVASTISSYSAKVSYELNKDVAMVVVGGQLIGQDSKLITDARKYGIPVYEEDRFFSYYGIDDDVVSNL